MTGLSLEAISSYVRDLSSACSAVRLIEDSLFAGSHDGLLVSWDASEGVENVGEFRLSAQFLISL